MIATPMSIALPKGRLQELSSDLLAMAGFHAEFRDRKLTAEDTEGNIRLFLVKNSDLPTYVHHGIAGLGICGRDVVEESGYRFVTLMELPFGSTKMCLAGKPGTYPPVTGKPLPIATKFTRFTNRFFHSRGIPIQIIKLNGSVELAPVLGLAPFIVDLVETGNTLRANDLIVFEELEEITVRLIANPAFYKIHYREIDALVETLSGEVS